VNINYELNEELLQDCINIANGLFYPLVGFMPSTDYHSVVNDMTLSSGEVWTIPIGLDVDHDTYIKAVESKRLSLSFNSKEVGFMEIDDCYIVEIEKDILKVFGTNDYSHPGVKKEKNRYKYRIGGKVIITDNSILDNSLKPQETKEYFTSQAWKTIAGFQTRNPIHKAHEHLQRVSLEICDALFINPLVGWKKVGDFSEKAVMNGYETMIKEYYTGLNIYFKPLRTPMRYAGPREAIFHAIIRRNLGCTHFIIGRDHAGVGEYYGKYEAQELARKIMAKHDLGIELLLLSEPYYCKKCEQMVSDKTCNHSDGFIQKISGTQIRAMLADSKRPSTIFMRAEVADSIIKLKENKFIKG
jgi:sulfate adenylyltransferase